MRRLAAAALLAIAILLPASTSVLATTGYQPAGEAQIVSLLNHLHQQKCGTPLRVTTQLHAVAEWRAKDMIVRNYYTHQVLGTPYFVWHWYPKFGVNWDGYAGENISWNAYPVSLSAAASFSFWMHSPGHYANMVDCTYNEVGVGGYRGANGMTMWVQDFARSGRVRTPLRRPAVRPRPRPVIRPRVTKHFPKSPAWVPPPYRVPWTWYGPIFRGI